MFVSIADPRALAQHRQSRLDAERRRQHRRIRPRQHQPREFGLAKRGRRGGEPRRRLRRWRLHAAAGRGDNEDGEQHRQRRDRVLRLASWPVPPRTKGSILTGWCDQAQGEARRTRQVAKDVVRVPPFRRTAPTRQSWGVLEDRCEGGVRGRAYHVGLETSVIQAHSLLRRGALIMKVAARRRRAASKLRVRVRRCIRSRWRDEAATR